jgi:hypothetical protein
LLCLSSIEGVHETVKQIAALSQISSHRAASFVEVDCHDPKLDERRTFVTHDRAHVIILIVDLDAARLGWVLARNLLLDARKLSRRRCEA